VEHILLDTAGKQHIVVGSGPTFMQFSIGGCDALIGPVALGLDLCRREQICAIGKELVALDEALRCSPSVVGEPASWTGHTRRLRDALIALDCQRVGANLREIAIVIYGRARIEREWPGNGLRKQLSRDMERGRALSNGGYRRLLR
jgi:hypothetical protein